MHSFLIAQHLFILFELVLANTEVLTHLGLYDLKWLISVVQMGALEIHLWVSQADNFDKPEPALIARGKAAVDSPEGMNVQTWLTESRAAALAHLYTPEVIQAVSAAARIGAATPETLIEIGSDHRLANQESLSVMQWACRVLASSENLPWMDDESETELRLATRAGCSSQEEASYICDACGEVIVIPLDLSGGSSQKYVEDCPVCCRTSIIHVELDENGESNVWAEPEQDYD